MLEQNGLIGWQKWIALIVLLPVVGLIGRTIYRLYFHPLSRFPGPKLWAISHAPHLYRHVTGTLTYRILELHDRYGDIVRIAPDQLSFSHPDAWNDIMGHQKANGKEFEKSIWFIRPLEDEADNIINSSRDYHGRLRRQMSHGFSEKSLREQEPLIQKYVEVLIQKLRERCKDGKEALALSDWYNFCTFDIIGDLAFGEPFGCLESSQYHDWVKNILRNTRYGTIFQALSFVPPLDRLLYSLIPGVLLAFREEQKNKTRAKMRRRMKVDRERHDLIEGLLRKSEELSLGLDELVSNAEILIIAGSETTATLLSGATYFLLANPECLQKVTEEVRTTFKSEDEITLTSVAQLPYMLACLKESLRIYPPVANAIPRVAPAGGAEVLGEFIPENTHVAIYQWALYHREKFWLDARSFHPERFLGDSKFANDRRDALQPFHVGPRNCLGRNLAYSEMRLILARVLYNFDLRLGEESAQWDKQKCYIFWQKSQLKVHLVPVS